MTPSIYAWNYFTPMNKKPLPLYFSKNRQVDSKSESRQST